MGPKGGATKGLPPKHAKSVVKEWLDNKALAVKTPAVA